MITLILLYLLIGAIIIIFGLCLRLAGHSNSSAGIRALSWQLVNAYPAALLWPITIIAIFLEFRDFASRFK